MQMLALASALALARCWANIMLKVPQILFGYLQTKLGEQEADVKPVAPSKIPVGWFRVEEEKRINRALSRDRSSLAASSSGKMVRERSMSRIPVFSSRSSCTVRIVGTYYEYTVYNVYIDDNKN